MIDEEATYREFGYYAMDLAPKSHKKVLAICKKCGKLREVRKGFDRPLCKSCANKGKDNPNFGNCLSEKSKKKIGNANSREKSHLWNGGEITVLCESCGKPFKVSPSRIKNGGGKYCSRKCQGIGQKGKKNHRWKGGFSFEPYCPKFNKAFKEYIRNKFDRKCFICGCNEIGNNGRKLSVHHVNKNKQCGCAKTAAEEKADNIACQFIPLCGSCHQKLHKNPKIEISIKNKLKENLYGWYI